MSTSYKQTSLLSPEIRVQAPFVKCTIGNYTFGVYSKTEVKDQKDSNGFYKQYKVQYPRYIQSLQVKKINGTVNQYTLNISYPVKQTDDPNFFEKVFSSVSNTRKIVFSYGDSSHPKFIYKEEEAIITKVTTSFEISTAVINYTISATSTATLGKSGSFCFINSAKKKPSEEIKKIFKNKTYGLQDIFTGMDPTKLDEYIPGDDAYVTLDSKTNISALDYVTYLVSCMVPASNTKTNISKDIYILTIHDSADSSSIEEGGTYFKVTRTNYVMDHSDAYTIDIGFNTTTAVTAFSIEDSEGYAMYYNYQSELSSEEYNRRISRTGEWEDVYAPGITSNNSTFTTKAEDVSWWTKITQYPIKANITILGLLRPAMLMTYVRLNVLFPGGHKHDSSGLYIVTSQTDTIGYSGYSTQLSLTRIAGDNNLQ